MTISGARVQPFYCPYCGEEDFVPAGEESGFWCRSCDRRFVVRFLGIGPVVEQS
jgi:transposase-like protein